MSTLNHMSNGTKQRIQQFRTATSRAETIKALPIKIEPKPSYEIVIAEDELEELEDAETLAELGECLPDNSPRYVLLAYPLTNREGIKQTPLILLYWKPMTVVSQEWKMLYASALEMVRSECGVSKFIEVVSGLEDDKDIDELKEQIEK